MLASARCVSLPLSPLTGYATGRAGADCTTVGVNGLADRLVLGKGSSL
eukprot:COSAG02_NODE_679_length_18565_cov_57.795245_18_plen_48_part_00